jgi:acyl phosphate:glycerol-3-phosphate acyltransferase
LIDLLVALGVGYLLGSIPSAVLAARRRGRDIFEVGSGNMGAMNTARNLGFGLGLAVFVADVGKGVLAALAGHGMALVAGTGQATGFMLALVAGVGAVAGHAWPAYTGFRGGKALATAFGVSLPVYPVAGTTMAVLLIALTLLMRRRPNLAAVLTMVLYPVVAYLAEVRAVPDQDRAFAILTAVLLISLIVLVRHLPSRSPPSA